MLTMTDTGWKLGLAKQKVEQQFKAFHASFDLEAKITVIVASKYELKNSERLNLIPVPVLLFDKFP